MTANRTDRSVAEPTPLNDRLDGLRWRGRQTYQMLSYCFSVRWNSASMGNFVQHMLEEFAIDGEPRALRFPPTPGVPPTYSVVDLGPSVAHRFRLVCGSEEMMASQDRNDVLYRIFWHVNAEAFRHTGDFLLIHAGAVAGPEGQGIVLPGSSGSGKTTLVAGLVREGFGFFSDEAAAIDPITRKLYPYPRKLNFKQPPGKLLPGLVTRDRRARIPGHWPVGIDEVRPGAVASPCDIDFVIAPRYARGTPTQLSPMGRAETLVTLGERAVNLFLYGGRALPLLAEVATRARGFRLVSGDLCRAIDAVRDLTTRGRGA